MHHLGNRIGKLESVFAGTPLQGVSENFTIAGERARWVGLAEDLGSLLDETDEETDEETAEELCKFLGDSLEHLFDCITGRTLYAPPPHLIRALRCYPQLLLRVWPLAPRDLRPELAAALNVNLTFGPKHLRRLRDWFWCIAVGDARLPPDVTVSTVGQVLRAIGKTDEGAGDEAIGVVCDNCGLMYPCFLKNKPGCPHCGSAQWSWPNTPARTPFPWEPLAAAELNPDTGETNGRIC